MNLLSRNSIIAATAVAVLGGVALAAMPAQAASADHANTAVNTGVPELTASQLAALPLTNRQLTAHEKHNLAIVLNDYYVAEGNHLDPEAFANSFTQDGVFNDVVDALAFRGPALRDVVISTAAEFPDVHRDLRSITVNGDVVTIQLHIQGTWKGVLHTPAGDIKPNGAKVDFPTDDFWYLKDGKVEKFDCLIGLSAEMNQMGIGFDYAAAVARG